MDPTDILIKIRKIIRSINLESKKIQKEYGVSIPQVLCLGFLQEAPGYQSTHGEIRRFLNLNASTVTGIIHRLEKKGYLARLPSPGDRRVINIALTASGSRLIARIPSLLHEQLSERLRNMEQNKLRVIQEGLDSLIDMLNIQTLEAPPMIAMDTEMDDMNHNPPRPEKDLL